MNLETPTPLALDPQPIVLAEAPVPPPVAAKAPEVPEASTWTLLIIAAALWLLRLRRRWKVRSGIR